MSTKFGIINFSNNCYLNVIIQLFLSTKDTSNIIIHYLDFVDKKFSQKSHRILNPQKLMKELSNGNIDIMRQNDSQETFTLILDRIKQLEKYFDNKIINKYTCQVCKNFRIKEDIFSTFYVYGNSLEESVKQYVNEENFELECDNCKATTNTIKTCKIEKLGQILVFFNVMKNKIQISENIKFSNKIYNLTGIIKHYGNQNSGHYNYIDYKNKLLIDDTDISTVKKITLDNIYLLFYTIN